MGFSSPASISSWAVFRNISSRVNKLPGAMGIELGMQISRDIWNADFHANSKAMIVIRRIDSGGKKMLRKLQRKF